MSDEPEHGDEPTDAPERTEVDEKMDRVYPNRDMTAENRPQIPEGGIEESPQTPPQEAPVEG